MKKIQILGGGCTKCNTLYEQTKMAAEELGLEFEMEKISDMMRYADFGVMVTPAMAVDGETKVSGRVPTREELKRMLAG
jgi:small redox-active disulfide protein 2